MKGDLHTHSYHSDGSNSPKRLFELAKNSGLSYIAITDHDYLPNENSYAEYEAATDVKCIHGVELSCRDNKRGRRVHILCYLPQNKELIKDICEETNNNRIVAGMEMARLVAEKYPISINDVEYTSRHSSSIFKQHIMQTLMDAGFSVDMFGELWDELFGSARGSCARACKSPDVWEVLQKVHEARGVAVMAHPFTYNGIDIMKELISAKLLDGIEVRSSKTNREQECFLEEFASANGLIKTAGSDFHGANASTVAPIGARTADREAIERIFELSEKL